MKKQIKSLESQAIIIPSNLPGYDLYRAEIKNGLVITCDNQTALLGVLRDLANSAAYAKRQISKAQEMGQMQNVTRYKASYEISIRNFNTLYELILKLGVSEEYISDYSRKSTDKALKKADTVPEEVNPVLKAAFEKQQIRSSTPVETLENPFSAETSADESESAPY